MTNQNHNIPRLNLVAIRSHHLQLSVQFYSLLGLIFVKECHGKGPEHYSANNGSYVFEIYPSNGSASVENVVRVGFYIKHFNEILDTLNKNGAILQVPPKISPWGRRMVVLDPDNNRVELIEE